MTADAGSRSLLGFLLSGKAFFPVPVVGMRLRRLIEDLRLLSYRLGILGFPYLALAFEAWDRLRRWRVKRCPKRRTTPAATPSS